MNNVILVILAFAIGLAFGGAFLSTCNTHAFDSDRNRSDLLNPWWGQQNLQREQERQEYQQRQYEQRRNPCP